MRFLEENYFDLPDVLGNLALSFNPYSELVRAFELQYHFSAEDAS